MLRTYQKLLTRLASVILMLAFILPSTIVLAEDRIIMPPTEEPVKSMIMSVSDWSITPETDPNILVQEFLGGGVTLVGTPSFSGVAALFSNPNNAIGFTDGIILSTGDPSGVPGPNSVGNFTRSNNLPGDATLNTLIPDYFTQDATVLEFDFILPPHVAISSFEYIFASEEYREYVDSPYNDVFGFFLDEQNIALLPSSTIPVAINNVNHLRNTQFYRDNFGGIDTQMDGLTTVLTAKVEVMPGGPHHIKLAIADAGDRLLDSNVFLRASSFKVNTPPQLEVANPEVSVDEGQKAENNGLWADADLDEVTLSASIGEVSKVGNTWSWSYMTTDGPVPDSQAVTITADDGHEGSAAVTFMLNVANVAPKVGEITVSSNLVAVGTPVNAKAVFTDPSLVDTHTALWNWEGGTSTGMVDPATRIATGSHTYTVPGIYTIHLDVTDDDGGVGFSDYQYIVVYDPSAGFVTGGGWIDSPEGAYPADPSLMGKASFGFVSKYLKGSTMPTGSTEFQFHVAGLNFHSTSYDWLVVAGSKAQFKGSGTVNGEEGFGFLLTAVDGTSDLFRIKIWEKATETIFYDNQLGMADTGTPTTAIASGNIVIHKAK